MARCRRLSKADRSRVLNLHCIPNIFPSTSLHSIIVAMAHRGETLHNEVSCIADLKALGSSKLPKMVRGE
jgi:molybdopterin synthase catalytic subunit